MKYLNIFHANLNYAYLTPESYEFVIRHSYEMMFDTMAEHFPGVKYVFEASGFTIEQMAERTPDVLAKLNAAIADGSCEFMGSPYAHPMLPNFPEEDGLWTLRFSNDIYQQHLGFQPRSFWNPECGWRSYVPKMVHDAGYANLIGDFEAYSRSLKSDGTPQRPEIYEAEHSNEAAFYNFAFRYDLPGSEPAIHFPFNQLQGLEKDQLRMLLRSDRIAQHGVRYFMGMDGYTLESYLELIRKYSSQSEGESEGAMIVFADDAEYVGTNGWFRLKYENRPDNVFEHTPKSREKLIDLVAACLEMGEFITFDEACATLPAIEEPITFDDDSAWHGAFASTWANTPMARILRPWQDLVREKLNASEDLTESTERQAWYHLTNSYNSDGQWPPTLPESPHIVHPYNYQYCFDNLLEAEKLVGGVDHSRLETDAKNTLNEILSLQQNLVLKKAEAAMTSGIANQNTSAQQAKQLIESSRDISFRLDSGHQIRPDTYAQLAAALTEARQLVGGIEIERSEEAVN
ncbi:polysaccharide deacetylase family protein [Adhaeretor mobilis]|uniref:Alpha-amylase 1 n=1 Tax=Adhaeretor mobilis TaxID=1930276 RepID=A0A517MZR5_9BACT|nr:hypothetical protein [Adhaeretor mobilis]QDT00377.1 Alpha-amylase 1 [Adhaeretor mobilis]